MAAVKRKDVELWYPTVDDLNRTDDQPTEVRIDLIAVRAADCIVVDYDFDRDGYRVRMPTIREWGEFDDDLEDEGLVEVAFIPAWETENRGLIRGRRKAAGEERPLLEADKCR